MQNQYALEVMGKKSVNQSVVPDGLDIKGSS
jgi:hypothetical protein